MIEKFSRIKVDLDLDKVFPNLQQICKRKKFILFNLMRLKRENSIREITFIKIRKLILNENRDKIRIIRSFVLHEIESNEIMIKLYQFYPEYLFERNSFYREILFSSFSFFPPESIQVNRPERPVFVSRMIKPLFRSQNRNFSQEIRGKEWKN